MRRRTLGVIDRDELIVAQLREVDSHDPERVIRVLEPLVLERRRERILQVAEQRLASVTVVFDAPHDPFNGAAVLRTCEAFGVHTVHVIERKESFLAAGSVTRNAHKWLDLRLYERTAAAIQELRNQGMTLVGAHPEGKLVADDLTAIPKLAIVLGNEHDGIAQDLMGACDETVRVPMRGMVESLNVSVTAAVLLSRATLGRPGDLDPAAKARLYARGLFFTVQRAREVLALEAEKSSF
jgi:tRNA (guanosine-2'-O-)-methyltransferase